MDWGRWWQKTRKHFEGHLKFTLTTAKSFDGRVIPLFNPFMCEKVDRLLVRIAHLLVVTSHFYVTPWNRIATHKLDFKGILFFSGQLKQQIELAGWHHLRSRSTFLMQFFFDGKLKWCDPHHVDKNKTSRLNIDPLVVKRTRKSTWSKKLLFSIFQMYKVR